MHELGDVAGKPGHLGRPLGIATVTREQMTIVLDHGAAAGGGDQDGIELALANCARPSVDIAPRRFMRLLLVAELMLKRAATGLILGEDDLDAVAPEQSDRRAVDGGLQHLLHAAEHERHALDRRTLGAEDPLSLAQLQPRPTRRHHLECRRAGMEAELRQDAAERPRQPAEQERKTESGWTREHLPQTTNASSVRAASGARSPRCERARDRRGACSRPRSGRWSCRTGKTGSGRCDG